MKPVMNLFKELWKTLRPSRSISGFTEQPHDFTPRASHALLLARKEAERMRHEFIGTEHVLLGLIRLGQGVAVNVLNAMGVNLHAVRVEVERQVEAGTNERPASGIAFTPRVKAAFALAEEERKALSHTYLGTEHLLLGLLREGDGLAGNVLRKLGLNTHATRKQILRELDPNFTEGDSPDEPNS